MKRLRWWLVGVFLVAWLQSALHTVDQAEFVYVTRFGERVAVHDGDSQAGLHWKAPWPIDSARSHDRRLQVFDLPAIETLTRDPRGRTVDKTIAVDAYVCWRIPDADALDRFVKTVGSAEQVRRLLSPRITGRVAAVIGNMALEDVIQAADPTAVETRTESMRRKLLGLEKAGDDDTDPEPLARSVLRQYGIEIVDLRFRRFSFPEAVRSSIAERIRSERQRKAAEYQSDGNREYARIVSEADRDASKVLAEARAKKERIEGEANAEADAIRNAAHAKDREFYMFLQKLSAYKAMLAETRDLLLLSTKNDLFDLLLKPPKPHGKDSPGKDKSPKDPPKAN